MKLFDKNMLEKRVGQLWSSLNIDGFKVEGSVGNSSFGDIHFQGEDFYVARQLVPDSKYSIEVGSNVGRISTSKLNDFAITMLANLRGADTWLIKFRVGLEEGEYTDLYTDTYGLPNGYEIGVRVRSDFVLELVWIANGEIQTREILFNEEPSYISLSREDDEVVMELNDRQVSIQSEMFELNEIEIGDENSVGSILVDKIAASSSDRVPTITEYGSLFRSQKMDTVARPYGPAKFSYFSENNTSELKRLTRSDFEFDSGYYYASVQNIIGGAISISRKTGFQVEYSLDGGRNWKNMPPNIKIDNAPSFIAVRHDVFSEKDMWIDFLISDSTVPPAAHYRIVLDGPVHLPSETGYGFYDATASDLSSASLTIEQVDEGIRTLEIFGKSDDWDLVLSENVSSIIEMYINGEISISDPTNELIHLVVVFDTDLEKVILNKDKRASLQIVGLGASPLEYSESDAYFIYNTFACNTYLSAMSEVGTLNDGLAPSSENSEAASAKNLEWNR